jgi:large subunit ribosomal protein L17
MKKRVFRKRMNGKRSRSDAMLRNMLYSLLSEGKVETTTGRARMLKRYADKEMSYAVKITSNAPVNTIESHVGSPKAAQLLKSYRDFSDKQGLEAEGGMTTIIKTRFRDGDNAEMSELKLIHADDFAKYLDSIKPKRKKKRTSRRMKSKKEDKGKKSEAKKDAEDKKEQKKDRTPKPTKEAGVPDKKKQGIISNIRGRILGRKVTGPEGPGKKGRSTARSGI